MNLLSLVKWNPGLFFLWYQFYRKNRGVPLNYFSEETILYFDGYPRSGNTFGIHLIKNSWPDLNVVHHFHSIAPIKIAIRKEIPIFILVRDPDEAICSRYLKELSLKNKAFNSSHIRTSNLTRYTTEYCEYYQWVFNHLDSIHLVRFKELILYPVRVVKAVNHALPEHLKLDGKLFEGITSFKNQSFGARDTMGSSLPNKTKDKAKAHLSTALKELPIITKAITIYERILEQS